MNTPSSGPPDRPDTHDRLPVTTLRGLLWATVNGWLEARAPQNAAALAYYSVFSLAPLLLIAVGMAGVLFGQEVARAQLLAQATALVGPDGARAVALMMGSTEAAPRAGIVSAVTGVVALLVGAVGVLAQLRNALNAVWHAGDAGDSSWRAFFFGYVVNVALVIATGFLLLVSLVATAAVSVATSAARHWLPGSETMWYLLDAVIGLVMTSLVFALVFKVVPRADVRWRDVRLGAAVTALLFTAGRLALGAYLGTSGSDSAYGAAGSVLALLAWVYYSAQLALFGAAFTYAYSRRYRRTA